MTTEAGAGDLAALAQWLRSHWLLVTVGVVLGLAGGIVALAVLPKSYESTTAVLVSPASSDPRDSLNMDTELQLVKSATVASRAATELGRPEAGGAVLARLSLFVPPNSTVIQITYEGTTPDSARAGAEAVAAAYLGARQDAATAQSDRQVSALRSQRDQLADEVDATRSLLADAEEGSQEERSALTDLDSLQRQIASLDSQIAALSTATVSPGVVITEATRPGRPASPDPILLLGSSLILGLMAGLLGAVAWSSRVARQVQSARQVAGLAGVDHAADLTMLSLWPEPASAGAGGQRELNRILAWVRPHGRRAGSLVLVTSTPGCRTAATAALSLASVATRPDRVGVVVVRNPDSRLLDTRGSVPKLGTLRADAIDSSGEVSSGAPRVYTAADADSLSRPLVWESDLLDLLERAAEKHLVLLELPPVAESADAYSLAAAADAVVVVVGLHQPMDDLREAVSALRPVTSGPIIAVLGPAEDPNQAAAVRTGLPADAWVPSDSSPTLDSATGPPGHERDPSSEHM